MKNINLAWFLLLTLWPAIISNGWWVLETCKISPDSNGGPCFGRNNIFTIFRICHNVVF